MKRQIWALVVGLMVLAFAGAVKVRGQTAAAPQSASALLERGIYAEETLGDMDGAMKIYEQILSQNQANRSFAAQAQYRMGLIYQKKNRPQQALQAMLRVVTEFSDVNPTADDAARRMPELREAAVKSGGPAVLKPKIVKTVPKTMANDVDPGLKQMTVTFDRKMQDRSWSWTGGGDTFPQSAGDISYDAAKTTCTFPVKLEPGKVYMVGINSPSHKNFKSADQVAAPRYMIVFATRSANGKPTEIPAQMLAEAKAINAAADKPEPVVTKTEPAALADNVPATVEKLTVTFDQEMADGSWSWTGGGETFPKIEGKISYDAGHQTCTMPVKLEPGRVYWVGINSPSNQNFQNAAAVPVRGYVMLFATMGEDGKPTPIPEDMATRAKAVNAANDALAAPQKPNGLP